MTLEELRDQLLPGAWNLQQFIENPVIRNLDIHCDHNADMLDLVLDGQHFPLFTRPEIEDESYREKFRPRVLDVLGGKFGAPLVTR